MSWLTLSLIGMLAFSVANIVQKALMSQKGADTVSAAGYFQLLVALMFLPLALKTHAFTSLTWIFRLWPLLLLMATAYTLLNLLLFRAFQLISAAEVSILSATRPFWVLLLSSFLLQEPLLKTKFFGIALIFTAILIIFYQKGHLRYTRGQLLSLLVGLVGSVGFIADNLNLKSAPLYGYLFLAFLLPGLGVFLTKPQAILKFRWLSRPQSGLLLLATTAVYFIGAWAIYAAVKAGGQASQISPIFQASTVGTVILSTIFLKDHTKLLRKFLAALAVVSGVILIT